MADTGTQDAALLGNWAFNEAAVTLDTGTQDHALRGNWVFKGAPAALDIAPTGIASAEALGTPSVAPGAHDVAPTGILTAEGFGNPVVSAGATVVQPDGVASADAFGALTVSAGPVSIVPTGIPSGLAFGTPTITPGALVIGPSGIPAAEAFGSLIVTGGEVSLGRRGIMREYKLGDYFEFQFQTSDSTGAEANADELPTYRVYAENSDTPVSTGTCAQRDGAHTAGYYFCRVQATALDGYEANKVYQVRVEAVLGGIACAAKVGELLIVPAEVTRDDQWTDARAGKVDDVGTLVSRIGAFAGSGVNTVLGVLRALARKDLTAPSDLGGSYDPAVDSLEALRDRGDAGWALAGDGDTTVTITCEEADGTPILGALVTVKNAAETAQVWVEQTDEEGTITPALDVTRDHHVLVSKAGWTFSGSPYTLQAGQTTLTCAGTASDGIVPAGAP